MTTQNEGMYPGEFLLTEQDGRLSRDTVTVTVPAATTYKPGRVLGKITASGKYVPYDDANSDGSEDAAAILNTELVNDDDAPADMGAVVVNFGAEVRKAALEFDEGVDEDKAYADLRALFIKGRD